MTVYPSYAPEIVEGLDVNARSSAIRYSGTLAVPDRPIKGRADLQHMVGKLAYGDGCKLHKHCETCPLPDCRYDRRSRGKSKPKRRKA